jgi:hypothetical protein
MTSNERNRKWRHSAFGKQQRYLYSISPKGRFVQQRATAKQRGILFAMTFNEWWSLWEPYWDKRGQGGYVMARYGDTGPYAVGNVRICSQGNNATECLQMRYLDDE